MNSSLLTSTAKPHWELTGEIVRAAVTVHRELGPGLLESVYRLCLLDELHRRDLECESEIPIPVDFRGRRLDCGYRADLIVEGKVLLELKSVKSLEAIHDAQTLTYLKLTGLRVGLLMNFNSVILHRAIRRFIR